MEKTKMKLPFVIFLCLAITSCSTKRKVVDSPLFKKDIPPESKDEIENLPKICQSQAIESLSSEVAVKPQQPRTVFTANRKAPPETAVDASKAVIQTSNTDSDEFIIYTAIGGERLSFVARSLLGSPMKTELLKNWNPDVAEEMLRPGQNIVVKVDALKPQPIYLSKELVVKYKKQLQRSILNRAPQKMYVVQAGDTLQTISLKLYTTTRRWTELYLLNYDRVENPDVLMSGTEINHF